MLIGRVRRSLRIRSAWALALAAPVAAAAQSDCPRGVLPAYSHNDYLDARPLADALTLGFRGVEADVFLVDGVLRLGHDRHAARRGGSLEEVYLTTAGACTTHCSTPAWP